MEKKRKLGRSLDEVADIWLSSTPINAGTDISPGFTPKTISILYPESPKVKGMLLSNFALELAKQGYASSILDYDTKDSSLRSVMNSIFQSLSKTEDSDESSLSHRVLKLYGMPNIHTCSKPPDDLSSASIPRVDDRIYAQVFDHNLQDSFIILSHDDSLETISLMDHIPPIVILVSRPRKESLLIAYAYIKAIFTRNPHSSIWIVMDEVMDRDSAVKAFTLLSQIIVRRLSPMYHALKFLGSIIHDQALGISMSTHYPLVLSEQHSVARDSIIRITANFIKSIENPD